MQLWVFEGVETEWVAARNEDEAHETLRRHYGISDEDIAGSYQDIYQANPEDVVMTTDEVNAETEEPITTTAAELMRGKTAPFVVGSTYT